MVAVLSLSSCSSPTSAYESAKTQPFGPCGSTYAELVAKAQQEGALILIGTPRGSAGSRAIIEDFTRRYDIDVSTILEDSSSADELTIIRTWKGDPRYPDVIDVSSAALEAAIREGLLADYRVQAYATIDDRFKRPDGFQVVNYFGLMGFGVNTSKVDHVPQTWADLEKPEYRGAIALNGDPRESGAGIQAIAAAALANGGSYDNILPGIDYFARLRKSGNLQLNQVNNTDVLDGGIPIAIDWNYNFPPLRWHWPGRLLSRTRRRRQSSLRGKTVARPPRERRCRAQPITRWGDSRPLRIRAIDPQLLGADVHPTQYRDRGLARPHRRAVPADAGGRERMLGSLGREW
jgi:putative spermidine/putrescine transport system substrate-binding protein